MDSIIEVLKDDLLLSFLISILLNIFVAIIGILPSVFITIFNVAVFGIFNGLLVSILGESLGAIISFYLYRKGFKRMSDKQLDKFPKIKDLINLKGKKAMTLIFLFRMFPYIPSGLLTYCAAIGQVSLFHFTIASTVGKIPALLIEVIFSQILLDSNLKNIVNISLAIISILLIIFILKKKKE